MPLHRFPIASILVALALFAGCEKKPSSVPEAKPDSSAHGAPEAASEALSKWQGTWNGPEGTYLRLTARTDSTYEVAIRDLDAERTFEGVGRGDRIHFTRDGLTESIRATDGEATGMKWLADKSNCLTVKTGEGYCRD